MEATFYLSPLRSVTTKPQCLLTLHQRIRIATPRNIALRSISLQTSISSSNSTTSHRFSRFVCANREPASPNSKNAGARTLIATGVAVVLACYIGVIGYRLKNGGFTVPLPDWIGPFSSSSESSSPTPEIEKTPTQKSLDALSEIFQRNSGHGLQKCPTLYSLLSEQLGASDLAKDYPNLLEPTDKGGKAASDLLYKEWENRKKGSCEHYYELGLLLTNVFINQGDYEKAADICEKIKMLAQPTDIRCRLNRVIIYTMLVVDEVFLKDSMGLRITKETDDMKEVKEARDAAILMLIDYMKNPNPDGKPPIFPQ